MIVPMTYVTSLAPKNVLKTKKLYFLFLHEMKSYDGLGGLSDLFAFLEDLHTLLPYVRLQRFIENANTTIK